MMRTLSRKYTCLTTLTPYLIISLIAVLIDQSSKIVMSHLFAYGNPYPITSCFNLLLIYNNGGAFSFLSTAGGWQRWVFTALSTVSVIAITYLLKKHSEHKLFCTALALILGGALGNVIDRIIYGYVIDFIDFHIRNWHWPVFNIADSSITNGAVLLVLDELRRVHAAP
ncbi:signal peptidase II [Candidatus Vallotiella sp. (ex Adelges kitamiensis)]|uniref:signal peptidase II n=1 Tax=Candidatus Vallotiella sp. (ex Adelges kitamiensis) TaxID=2864217 RepID=UPI001CE2FD37|nr:signal peptidase II [Candidatus Vallotia sp. (ex Adelges kitamiensis)]